MKIVFYVLIIIVFLLVTFFGLGPVIYADGKMSERLLTLAIVLLIYLVLILISFLIAKHYKKVE